MNRAIVLIVCLAAAGAVAGYTHYSHSVEQAPVFTVHAPHRATTPSPAPASSPQRAIVPPGDRPSLARELQRELKRVGCYGGDINGVWTTSSRMAMKSFTDHVNASLPIDNPDHVLLSLVQGHRDAACGGLPLKATTDPVQAEDKSEPPAEKSSITTGSIVPAAATALAVSAAIPRTEPKAGIPGDQARPAAVTPPADDAPPKSGRPERSARHSGPVPSERVYERRTRRYSNSSRPPKFVRNILRAFGVR